MKKTIFSLFIAALVAVVMTSCGKKNEIPAGVKINQEVYSVTVPEGWSYDVTGSGKYQYLNLTKNLPGANGKISFHAYANIADTPDALMQKMCRTRNGWQHLSKQELGDNTWSVAYAPNTKTKFAPRYSLFSALKRGVLYVQLEDLDINGEEVQQILSSVEMK